MENGVNTENNNVIKMGATGNPNAARLATLQDRKKTIEESLAKCHLELRQLCIQEADLTGIIPQEMPLEAGESPPLIRRRMGTAYQLPENLIKNSNNTPDQSIADLELQIQLTANMADAALGLAKEQNISKTLRRQHQVEYRKHKAQHMALQDKLAFLKDEVQQQQQQQQQVARDQLHKQRKKPRPAEQDDNISVNTNSIEPFAKSELRHSLRSNKCSVANDNEVETRAPSGYPRSSYKNSNSVYLEGSYPRHEEALATGIYRLSMNGYKSYMERRENMANIHMPYNSQHNTLQYSQHHYPHSPQHSSHYQQNLQTQQQNQIMQHQKRSSQPLVQQVPNYLVVNSYYNQMQQFGAPKNHLNSPMSPAQMHRQSSPITGSSNTQQTQYSPAQSSYRYSNNEQNFRTQNPHQIQPHQQYEQMTTGLGGYWKQSETGVMVWCNSSESNWHRDKRFGSLDRRKNKRIHKRVSPCVDSKSATLATVPTYSDHIRTASIKSPQVINRRSQDNRQLVRTQSLGSVGAQTIDSVWPSDDNSSCESDNRSINDSTQGIRRNKQKEWLETSLDGPVSPIHTVLSRSQSAIPAVLFPEEKYVPSTPQHVPPPPTPKPPLEIPAESHPSPRMLETNLERYNNNIPENCTVVQAGLCKPYHEETKPFEMCDVYKYSTKYNRSPVKHESEKKVLSPQLQKNLSEAFEESAPSPKTVPAGNFSPNNSASLNSSLDLSQLANSNVAEHFSNEMNAWYKSQKFQNENGGGTSKGQSTATLV